MATHRQASARLRVIEGNLLSREDCAAATQDVAVIFHLAAGRGEKSFPDAYMNSVVTTRNLLDASVQNGCLRRFVNISSFAVYTNTRKSRRRLLDESCPLEQRPELRGDAYSFAKARQDEMVAEYGKRVGIPYVIVRPGYVYGPGNSGSRWDRHVWSFSPSGRRQHHTAYVCGQLRGRDCTRWLEKRSQWSSVQCRRRRSSLEQTLLASLQTKCGPIQIPLCAPPRELCALLFLGEVLQVVRGAVAARLQPQSVARLLEEDVVQQRPLEDTSRLDAKSADGGGIEASFPKLPRQNTTCLKWPSSDAARLRTLTLRRSCG